MEDVDDLLILSLQQMSIPACQGIKSLENLQNPDVLLPVTMGLLNIILGKVFTEYPTTLSSKYKMCMQFSEKIKTLGYTGDLNFNTFLYPDIKDIRKVVGFMMDKVPKEEAKAVAIDDTPQQAFQRRIKEKVSKWTQKKWQPPFDKTHKLTFRGIVELHDGAEISEELKPAWETYKNSKIYWQKRLAKGNPSALYTTQVYLTQSKINKSKDLDFSIGRSSNKTSSILIKSDLSEKSLPSLLHVLERPNLTSQVTEDIGSVFAIDTQNLEEDELLQSGIIEGTPPPKSADSMEQKEKEIQELEEKLKEISEENDQIEASISTAKANITATSQSLKQLKTDNENLKKDLEQKHRMATALTEGNSTKLEEEIKDLEGKLELMEKEWNEYKEPILEEIKEKEIQTEKLKESYSDKIEEIKQMKEEMREMAEEAEDKEELLEILKQEEAKGTSSINRNTYVKRITEIVEKLKRQKKDMTKIVKDITQMQKSVELTREALKRTDAATEDLVFQEAKKNSAAKVIYKLLVDLRESYAALIRNVEDQFRLQSKMSDLEIRIESAISRNAKHDINQLRQDLEKIKAEQQ
ncbi:unnamed protein product [Blepharisma stoltei]|uniref:Coiled-coil domain-containing protein 22 homolog n=1 Tax=Blepharisma stoltei TaxID=1481888 RepID=A0AAU9ILC7_9CILI|nr:unnamed protein product [Blepharisma stoltei]